MSSLPKLKYFGYIKRYFFVKKSWNVMCEWDNHKKRAEQNRESVFVNYTANDK